MSFEIKFRSLDFTQYPDYFQAVGKPFKIFETGGTTGVPKLIPRTHNDYTYNSSLCQILSGSGADTALLIGIPITHNFPTTFLQGVFMCGGKVVISPSPAPDAVLSLIEEEGVTTVPAVPATVISYVNDPDLQQYDISSRKLCLVGGSKLQPEVAQEIGPKLGSDVQQILGMAEGPNFCELLPKSAT